MSIKYEIAKHATANPSNVLSGGTYGGHMFSILFWAATQTMVI